ncbi:hypothetical protein ACWECC_34560 [Streptomyces microflavus]
MPVGGGVRGLLPGVPAVLVVLALLALLLVLAGAVLAVALAAVLLLLLLLSVRVLGAVAALVRVGGGVAGVLLGVRVLLVRGIVALLVRGRGLLVGCLVLPAVPLPVTLLLRERRVAARGVLRVVAGLRGVAAVLGVRVGALLVGDVLPRTRNRTRTRTRTGLFRPGRPGPAPRFSNTSTGCPGKRST